MLVKILLIVTFLIIFWQDITQRQAYWFLFPLVGFFSGLLYFNETLSEHFIFSTLINLFFVLFLLLIIYMYSKYKLKTTFKSVIGLGDILLFIFLCGSFASVSFITIFVFSLIFSLLLHLILKKTSHHKTVPLAGYMSLFFLLTYIVFWTGLINSLYIL